MNSSQQPTQKIPPYEACPTPTVIPKETPPKAHVTTSTTIPLDGILSLPMPYVSADDFDHKGFVAKAITLIIFHIVNVVIGFAGFVLAVGGVVVVPILFCFCCLGAPVLQALFWLLKSLVEFDIALANMITSEKDKIQRHPHIECGFTAEGKVTMLEKLFYFSGRSFAMVIYFGLVKFAVACISAGILYYGLAMWIVVLVTNGKPDIGIGGLSFKQYGIWYVVLVAGMSIAGLVLVPLHAWLSRKLTELFCGDTAKAVGRHDITSMKQTISEASV